MEKGNVMIVSRLNGGRIAAVTAIHLMILTDVMAAESILKPRKPAGAQPFAHGQLLGPWSLSRDDAAGGALLGDMKGKPIPEKDAFCFLSLLQLKGCKLRVQDGNAGPGDKPFSECRGVSTDADSSAEIYELPFASVQAGKIVETDSNAYWMMTVRGHRDTLAQAYCFLPAKSEPPATSPIPPDLAAIEQSAPLSPAPNGTATRALATFLDSGALRIEGQFRYGEKNGQRAHPHPEAVRRLEADVTSTGLWNFLKSKRTITCSAQASAWIWSGAVDSSLKFAGPQLQFDYRSIKDRQMKPDELTLQFDVQFRQRACRDGNGKVTECANSPDMLLEAGDFQCLIR